ncbi:MAG: adenylate kinase family protein [Vampirovibrionales bacterium]
MSFERLILLPFISPPAAGKGTQTQILCQTYHLARFDTGSQLRAVAQKETDLGKRVATILAAGQLVDLPVVMDVLKDGLQDALNQAPEQAETVPVLLDGFPRSLEQTDALFQLAETTGLHIPQAFYFDVPYEIITERAIYRRIDSETGAIYNLKFNPPPPEVPESRLTHRTDDYPDRVEKRLTAYEQETAPILARFEEKGLLTRVDANKPMQEVTQALVRLFDQYVLQVH